MSRAVQPAWRATVTTSGQDGDVIEIVDGILDDPQLDRPLFLVVLSGWVDAGTAGESAADFVADHLEDGRELARVDLAESVDLQQVRPTVRLARGVTRSIDWPQITFTAGKLGRDLVLCQGPEPSLRWRTFSAEAAELARRLDARMVATLGGMPAPVSHRRPMRVLSTATSRSLAQEVAPPRQDYLGPTGLQTVVQVAAGAAGIPGVGLWAQVPHYLSGTISPVAARALLSRLSEVAGVDVDLRPLDQEAESYERQVEETIQARSDLQELVAQLDAQVDDLPTGDELASEIEEFLRGER